MLNQMLALLKKNSLVLNSYLIILTRAVGSATGYVFWVLAARLVLPAEVGIATSIISAALLAANLSQLGYGYGLARFLPHTEKPSELISLALETTTIISLILSFVFLAAIRVLFPDLVVIQSNFATLLSFVVLAVTTSLNQVVNWSFFARRKFNFSLFSITAQSLLAIALLPLFSLIQKGFAPIVWAYTVSAAAALGYSTWLFLKRAESSFKFRLVLPKPGNSPLAGYLLSSYVTDQLLKSTNYLLPLLILNILGAEANAYFYMAWAVVSGLTNLIGGVSASFFSEGANQPEKAQKYLAASLKLVLIYSTAACLGMGVISPILFSFFGAQYVSHAIPLFLILLVSIIPGTAAHLFLTYFRIQTQTRYLLIYTCLGFGLDMLGAYAGMRLFGLMGLGYGWFTAQILLLAAGIILWRNLFRNVEKGKLAAQTAEN